MMSWRLSLPTLTHPVMLLINFAAVAVDTTPAVAHAVQQPRTHLRHCPNSPMGSSGDAYIAAASLKGRECAASSLEMSTCGSMDGQCTISEWQQRYTTHVALAPISHAK
jgi:hypothetical protein